jgi:hypothetical protein
MGAFIAVIGIIFWGCIFIAGLCKEENDRINEDFFDEEQRQIDLNVDRERKG